MKWLHHCSVLNIETVIDQSALLHIHVIDCIVTLLLVILIGFDLLTGQWLALGLVQRLTLARVAPTWGPFPSAGDQCWSAGLTWTDQLSNVDLHVCGYDVLFCCSVQCILPYEFPVHLIQFQIFFWDNTVSEFRDSFVALHSITLFMSVHVTSVGRCLHCFKNTLSCCRVHMHLFETLSLQLENQDFLQQRWFNMASLFKTTLLWSLSLFILIFVVFPHCDLCWMAALHDDIIKKAID